MQVQRYGLQAYCLVVLWSACRTKPTGARGKETIVEREVDLCAGIGYRGSAELKGAKPRMSRKPQCAVSEAFRCLAGL